MGAMESYQIGELGVFVVSVLGSVAVVLKASQSSRCRECSIFWGCASCERDPPLPQPPEPDVEAQQ